VGENWHEFWWGRSAMWRVLVNEKAICELRLLCLTFEYPLREEKGRDRLMLTFLACQKAAF